MTLQICAVVGLSILSVASTGVGLAAQRARAAVVAPVAPVAYQIEVMFKKVHPGSDFGRTMAGLAAMRDEGRHHVMVIDERVVLRP